MSAAVGDAEREARLGLSCLVEPGSLEVARAVAEHGATAVWAGLRGGSGALARRASALDLTAVARQAVDAGARFVIPGDAEWPRGLDDLGAVSTRAITPAELGGLPLGIWLRGPAGVATRSVAIVGSRASTAYGEGVAADLAADLAEAGVAVISGGAYGIDAAAHRGALAGGGATVAVLACGVDVAYPQGNASLLAAIAADHLVLSELAPGSHPTRVRFLARNRLIAAAASAIVVVEAAHRSGARNTASWARALGRPLLAVPGPITSAGSVTPNQLIRDHVAETVTGAADVLEIIGRAGEDLAPELPPDPARPVDALPADLLGLFEALPGRGGIAAGDLALRLARELPRVIIDLGRLEEAGLALQLPDGRWKIRPGGAG
ncbi:DNA-processing protein DprA [Naumannella huperziae]